ncbi:hypothetical protein GA0115239_10905 [Streptomyces sp. BpilaLS-43]|uniref:hypothetical protein n=1 Tax=Streptomyces sp. BpilaLS-43 TaxID=1839778 RepID=UPI00081B4E1C|nr:hypothetical protein [Streptomyces sp. BpilaLS-43]SCD81683.1 hypothetical protein GA0115239_10905 [Streptomyces sp. BpilaLS-43]
MHEGKERRAATRDGAGRPRGPGVRDAARALVGLALFASLVGCTADGNDGQGRAAPPRFDATASPFTAEELRHRLLSGAEAGNGVERSDLDEGSGSLSVQGSTPDCEERAQYEGRLPVVDLMGTTRTAAVGYRHGKELLVQRLYSDEPAALMTRTQALFTTLTACPRYTQIISFGDEGTAEYDVRAQRVEVAGMTGPTYGYLETKSQADVPGSTTATKVVAVLRGRVAVLLQGTPAMVDRALAPAVRKATS